jgi:hypothetical protein
MKRLVCDKELSRGRDPGVPTESPLEAFLYTSNKQPVLDSKWNHWSVKQTLYSQACLYQYKSSLICNFVQKTTQISTAAGASRAPLKPPNAKFRSSPALVYVTVCLNLVWNFNTLSSTNVK